MKVKKRHIEYGIIIDNENKVKAVNLEIGDIFIEGLNAGELWVLLETIKQGFDSIDDYYKLNTSTRNQQPVMKETVKAP